MKNIEQAFLADILADPFDDTPRLVYADWLEENGLPTVAGFIRSGLEFKRITVALEWGNGGYRKLGGGMPQPGEHRFGNAPGLLWVSLPSIGEAKLYERRGWIERAVCTTWIYEGQPPAVMFRRQPIVELKLTDVVTTLHYFTPPGRSIDARRAYLRKSQVPADLYALLSAKEVRVPFKGRRESACEYHTDEAALTDLSRAAVNLGRALVGLPPIDWDARSRLAGCRPVTPPHMSGSGRDPK